MDDTHKLLAELAQLGEENDSSAKVRSDKLLNITEDTGEFLSVMLTALDAVNVLEVGTSNGYSTIWIASSIGAAGKVTTLEILDHKITMAKENFSKAGLADKIDIVKTDAAEFFEKNTTVYDMVFLDAERVEYMKFADAAIDAVRPGGILLCDNAISHADEMDDFINYVKASGKFRTCTVPVGKGEFVACKIR